MLLGRTMLVARTVGLCDLQKVVCSGEIAGGLGPGGMAIPRCFRHFKAHFNRKGHHFKENGRGKGGCTDLLVDLLVIFFPSDDPIHRCL